MGLKICSFNIRYDNPNDGINSFENRKDLILREFPKYEADVVGFQEVLPHMRDWLEESMPDYTVVGTGRAAGGRRAYLYSLPHGSFSAGESLYLLAF